MLSLTPERLVGSGVGGDAASGRAVGTREHANHLTHFPMAACPCRTGRASQISLIKEIAIGLTMGTALGFWWQNYHW